MKVIFAVIVSIALVFSVVGISNLFYPKTKSADIKKRGYRFYIDEAQVFKGGQINGESSAKSSEKKEVKLDFKTLFASASIKKGKKIFKKCTMCHYIEKEKGHKIGPNLYNVLGASKARHKDFEYSKNLASKKGEKWSYQNIFAFIHSPKDYIPGTKMSFAGLKKYQDIANVVAYIKTFSPDAPDIP